MRLAVVLVAVVPSFAHADPVRIATRVLEPALAPPGMSPPRDDAPAIDSPAPQTPIARRSDIVGASRGLAIGTALTVPQGAFEVSGRMLAPFAAGLGIAVGVSRTTEIWAEAGGAFHPDDEGPTPKIFGVGAKQVLARGHTWQIAATGSLRHVQTSGSDDGQLATIGGVATVCSDDCDMIVTGGAQLLFVEDEDTIPMFTFGASFGGATKRFFVEGVHAGNRDGRVTMLVSGVRLGGRKTAFDFGVFAVQEDSDTVVLPMLSLLVRS